MSYISLHWRFPEDGDLSPKHGGSLRFMDNLWLYLPAHWTEWMILIFEALLFYSLCVSFRCLYLATGAAAWLAPLSICLRTCAAKIVLEGGFCHGIRSTFLEIAYSGVGQGFALNGTCWALGTYGSGRRCLESIHTREVFSSSYYFCLILYEVKGSPASSMTSYSEKQAARCVTAINRFTTFR